MSSTAIRFGSTKIITIEGTQTVTETDVIHNFATAKSFKCYTQNVFAESRKQVLAEALKLIDRLDEDDIVDVAFGCAKQQSNSKYKMEVSWTSK